MVVPKFLQGSLPFITMAFLLSSHTEAANLSGISAVNSTAVPGAYLTYKQTTICETTPGVKSYSGYVHLPPNTVSGHDYEIHTYFWFFESRTNASTSPLSLWLQGGPGAPSVSAAISENGPCVVTRDSTTTELNPFSWNNEVNMLFIDQPVGTGFSYDSLVSGLVDEVASPFVVEEVGAWEEKPASNFTHPAGVFSSQDMKRTTNTTGQAAEVMWYVMQVWMQDFPKYKSPDNTFSIWGESYGGHYCPIFADYFTQQSKNLTTTNSSQNLKPLKVDTVGIINGCIDSQIQTPFFPEFAFNNTYGIQAINETVYSLILEQAVPRCKNLTEICHRLADEKDPGFRGNDEEVNEACSGAFQACFKGVHAPFYLSGRNVFDITSPLLSSFPPKFAAGYLNTKEIQDDLGVPVNFTGLSAPVSRAFDLTGDFMRGNGLARLARLLVDDGVKVSLVYGDKDYQCNWLGGEQVALALGERISQDSKFENAGYATIQTDFDSSEEGGFVRQVGNLSFVRVIGAGHSVPYYRPQTAQEIFRRVTFNRDIATGEIDLTRNTSYSSAGPSTAFTRNTNLPQDEKLTTSRDCYIWDILETCDATQKELIANGSAVTKAFIMLGFVDSNGRTVLYSDNEEDGKGNGTSPGNGTTTDTPSFGPTDGKTSGAAGGVINLMGTGLVAALFVVSVVFML